MNYLKKEQIFFERDDEGNVIPVEIELSSLPDKPLIKATPMSKGELSAMAASSKNEEIDPDTDIDIIINHCKEPSFSESDRESLKTASKISITNAMTIAILALSTNLSQEQLLEQGKGKAISDELKDFR